MIGAFTRVSDGTVAIKLRGAEARLLADLFESLGELLTEEDGAGGRRPADPLAAQLGLAGLGDETAAAAPDDPALARLLPDAYPEDPEASAEFRRFTRGDLSVLRRERARLAESTLAKISGSGKGGRITLGPDESAAWLGALNDLRLVLGTRLEVTQDGQEPGERFARDDPRIASVPIYQYLGYLQETLLEALSG